MTQLNKNFQKKYPNIKINRVAKSFTDLQATLKLAASGPEPARRHRGQQRLLGDGPARQGRACCSPEQVRRQVRLEHALLDRDPEDEQVHLRREQLRHRQPLRPADDGRGRRRLLQQGEAQEARPEDADDVPAVRGGGDEGARPAGETPIQFGNLDKWPGIHEFEELMLQSVSEAYASDWIFGARGGKINFNSQGTLAAAAKLQAWAKAGCFTKGYEGLGYDPSWPAFGKGKGVFLISGSWLTADLQEGARQERRLLPAAAADGQAAGDAGRRGPAVGDQLEVEERRTPRRRTSTSSRATRRCRSWPTTATARRRRRR